MAYFYGFTLFDNVAKISMQRISPGYMEELDQPVLKEMSHEKIIVPVPVAILDRLWQLPSSFARGSSNEFSRLQNRQQQDSDHGAIQQGGWFVHDDSSDQRYFGDWEFEW